MSAADNSLLWLINLEVLETLCFEFNFINLQNKVSLFPSHRRGEK